MLQGSLVTRGCRTKLPETPSQPHRGDCLGRAPGRLAACYKWAGVASRPPSAAPGSTLLGFYSCEAKYHKLY